MTIMAFTANPLSLCIPEHSFEAWLKENGLLEVLESTPCSGNLGNQHAVLNGVGYRDNVAGLKKLNPFEGLTVEDVCKRPVPWTEEFLDCGLGPTESYSWPVNLTQAKFRMQENLKRYTGNYMILAIIIFLCFLYKMPLAFLGIIFIFGLWDTIRIFGNKWSLEKQNLSYRILAFIGNLGTGLILVYCKVAVALLWAGVVSLVIALIHSFFRKVTSPSKKCFPKWRRKR